MKFNHQRHTPHIRAHDNAYRMHNVFVYNSSADLTFSCNPCRNFSHAPASSIPLNHTWRLSAAIGSAHKAMLSIVCSRNITGWRTFIQSQSRAKSAIGCNPLSVQLTLTASRLYVTPGAQRRLPPSAPLAPTELTQPKESQPCNIGQLLAMHNGPQPGGFQ